MTLSRGASAGIFLNGKGGLSVEPDGGQGYCFRESGEGQRMVACDKVFSGDGFTAAYANAADTNCLPVHTDAVGTIRFLTCSGSASTRI